MDRIEDKFLSVCAPGDGKRPSRSMTTLLKNIFIIYIASKKFFWGIVDIRPLQMKVFVTVKLSDSNKLIVDIKGIAKINHYQVI